MAQGYLLSRRPATAWPDPGLPGDSCSLPRRLERLDVCGADADKALAKAAARAGTPGNFRTFLVRQPCVRASLPDRLILMGTIGQRDQWTWFVQPDGSVRIRALRVAYTDDGKADLTQIIEGHEVPQRVPSWASQSSAGP